MNIAVTSNVMKNCDNVTINEVGIPSMVLMERAALSVFELIIKKFNKNNRILILAGSGNNGADGLAVARLLFCKGYAVDIFLSSPKSKSSLDFQNQLKIIHSYDINILNENNSESNMVLHTDILKNYDVVVDAIFGTGISRDVNEEISNLIDNVNQNKKYYEIVSIDISSGINSDNGHIMGNAIKADMTVCLAYAKVGVLLGEGADYSGKITISDIGINDISMKDYKSNIYCNLNNYNYFLPKRHMISNKGSYGKALVIAGGVNMPGACYLAAKSAYKMGAGLVYVATHSKNINIIAQLLPEAIVLAYDNEDDLNIDILDEYMNKCDALLLGCGIGENNLSKNLCEYVLLKYDKVGILDADALNYLSKKNTDFYNKIKGKYVLTPHLKEYSRLINIDVCDIAKNVLLFSDNFSKMNNFISVIKDFRTIINNGKLTFINTYGSNAMATAGSGDVLAGMILGALSGLHLSYNCDFKGEDIWKLICSVVELHSLAGDIAADKSNEYSMMSTDIIDNISYAIKRQRGEIYEQ